MNVKQSKLERVEAVATQYDNALKEAEGLRKHLTTVAYDAHQNKCTQQEIADRTSLSRQRIQQLLTEVENANS